MQMICTQAMKLLEFMKGLLEYHYLKRPYTLRPNLAEAMPLVSKDGLTYTFKIRKGVVFQDDTAFEGGKGRELVAADFVYSIKRLADPKLQALGWWIIDGKIKGLNEWRKKYSELPKVDYNEEIEGLRAVDKYTVEFKLTRPFPHSSYTLLRCHLPLLWQKKLSSIMEKSLSIIL